MNEYKKEMTRKLDKMIEILKSYIDDFTAEWKEKEEEYQIKLEDIQKENDRLRLTVMDLEQELEFATKRTDELVLKNTNLMIKLDQVKSVENEINSNNKKWYQIFYK